jgi:hypothetical protein
MFCSGGTGGADDGCVASTDDDGDDDDLGTSEDAFSAVADSWRG